MNVISIGTDRKLFEKESGVYKRTLEYSTLFTELHIIVFAKKSLTLKETQIAPNVWIYPTNSVSKFFYVWDALSLAKKVIRKKTWDTKSTVITCQDPFETGLVGVRLKKKFNFKLQLQIHTDFLSAEFIKQTLVNRLRVKVAQYTLKYADSIRVVSERIKRSVIEKIQISEKKISVLPIFVNRELFNTSQLQHITLYPQFSSTILMASRLTKEKNIIFALDVFKEVREKYPKTGLIIIGEGPEVSNLKAHAKKLKIQDSVIFEPWQNNLASYYASADIFLLTSLYEGYGMTLVEAGLSGAAIVTSDVGIAGDALKDSENAFICTVNNKDAFVQKISQLLSNTELKNKFKVQIQKDINNFILQDKKEYLKLYKQSLEL